jgi:anti-anti-sigma factor
MRTWPSGASGLPRSTGRYLGNMVICGVPGSLVGECFACLPSEGHYVKPHHPLRMFGRTGPSRGMTVVAGKVSPAACKLVISVACVRVVISGELDFTNRAALASWLEQASLHERPLSVDLAGVTFLTSDAVRVLVDAYRVAARHQQPWSVDPIAAGEQIKRILVVTGLWEIFTRDHDLLWSRTSATQPEQ